MCFHLICLILASDIWKRLFPARHRRSSFSLFRPGIGGVCQRISSTKNKTQMDLNPFRLCSGLKFLGYFMIVLVIAIIAVSYYAVVVLTWGPQLLDGGSHTFFSLLIIFVFHMLVILENLLLFLLSSMN